MSADAEGGSPYTARVNEGCPPGRAYPQRRRVAGAARNAMADDSTVFVGIDAAKAKHAVALAESGRHGEVRYLGEIEASPDAVKKLITRLAKKHGKLVVCYG
jgi:hypothetical protein